MCARKARAPGRRAKGSAAIVELHPENDHDDFATRISWNEPAAGALLRAQDGQRPIFRVKVDMVVLSFQVTDSKNHYINGLKPTDFRIYEDGILQKISTFAEGAKAPLAVAEDGSTQPAARRPARTRCRAWNGPMPSSAPTSSCSSIPATSCISGFVYAEDAIADFVRGLDRADSVAVYTFSRNLSRAATLTHDHSDAIAGLRKSRGGRRYGALQRPAADPARCRQGARPQGGDRLLQRSGQRQHGGARRRARRGRRRRHSDLRDLHQRSQQGSDLERRVPAHRHSAPAARPTGRRPGRSRWRRSRTFAKIWATPTPSLTIRRPIPTKASARSRLSRPTTPARSGASAAAPAIAPAALCKVLRWPPFRESRGAGRVEGFWRAPVAQLPT